MILTGLFMFLLAVTVGLAALQLLGYQVLNSLIILIVVDFMALGAHLQINKKNTSNQGKAGNPHNLIPRLEGIEKTCSNILKHVNTTNSKGIDTTVVKQDIQKSKDDLTYLLERIARKTMDLEQKIDGFGQVLTKSVLDINGRVKILEGTEAIEQVEQVAESRPEKQTIPVGEIIYVDEDAP